MSSPTVEAGDAFSIELPVDPAYLGSARLFAGAVARNFGCSDGAVEDLKVAISEACTNALIAHRERRSGHSVRLHALAGREELLFRIEEGGVPLIEPEDRQTGDHPSTEQLGRLLGVELVRSLFPGASVDRNERGGLDLTFVVTAAEGVPETA